MDVIRDRIKPGTVLVTIDLTTLASDLAGVGLVGLIGEEPISAGQVRRLACTAQIIPVVLGGDSESPSIFLCK